jgi:Ni/Co efflux regulator RcnB
MKKLVLGMALAALVGSTAAFACQDEHETAAKETKKQPVAQKTEKKAVKAQKKADKAADKSTVAQVDKR